MSNIKFQTAAVIGTGMMGPGIAVTLALAGVRARIVSRLEERAQAALETALAQVHLLREHGLIEHVRAHRAVESLSAGADLEATIPQADLVIESVPESMALKQDLFTHLDSVCSPAAVLASNTSGLSITMIAANCRRPERVLTTHFWNPPHLMPLVEIVKGERTAGEVAEAMRELLAACGKVPVVVKKDRPGQLGNRLQMALWREAMNVVAEGIADPEDVDLVIKNGLGLRMPVYGVFEHADAVGLEMVRDVMDYVARDLYSQPRAPEVLHDKLRRGETGAQAGKGFYDWSRKDLRAVLARRDRFVLEFLKAHRGAQRRAAEDTERPPL